MSKPATITLDAECAPQSISAGGASYLLTPGEPVEVPVEVAASLTHHPRMKVTGVPKSKQPTAPAEPVDDESPATDDEPPSMGDDETEREA